MYISKEQLEARLKGQSNLTVIPPKGNKKASIPTELKVLAGVLAHSDTQENVAKSLGIDQSSVSLAKRGLMPDGKFNEELANEVGQATKITREAVSDRAVELVMKSLGLVEINTPKLKDAISASTVAKNMATVAEKLARKDSANLLGGPRIQININGAARKEESDYEVIEVESVAS